MHRALLTLALVIAVIVVGCSPAREAAPAGAPKAGTQSQAPATRTKIVIREAFTPSEVFIAVNTARAKKFYEALNLDVEQQPGQGAQSSVKLVGNGDNAIGTSDAGTVMVGVEQGVPITAIGALFLDVLTAAVSLKESNITKLSDLVGKTVGGIPGSAAHLHYQAAIKASNVDAGKISFVALSGDALTTSLAQKKVDAVLVFYTQVPPALEAQGVSTNAIRFRDGGVSVLGHVFIVNNDYLKKNRPAVEAFLKGTYQGLQYAREHPDEAVQLLVEANPTLKKEIIAKTWALTMDVTMGDPSKPVGWMEPKKWENVYEILRASGQIKTTVDPKTAYDNSLVDAIAKK